MEPAEPPGTDEPTSHFLFIKTIHINLSCWKRFSSFEHKCNLKSLINNALSADCQIPHTQVIREPQGQLKVPLQDVLNCGSNLIFVSQRSFRTHKLRKALQRPQRNFSEVAFFIFHHFSGLYLSICSNWP